MGLGPAVADLPERRRVEVVELVATVSSGRHEPRRLQDVEVLRVACRVDASPCRVISRVQILEERLAIPILELIEDGPSGGIGESLEHVAHAVDDRQVTTCMSRFAGRGLHGARAPVA